MRKNLLIYIFFSLSSFVFSQEDDFVTDIAYIQEIIVKSTSTQAYLDLYSVNIIDYRVYGKDILSLKKIKRKYYIGIDYAEKEAQNYVLDIEFPRFIFSDCMNNVFVLNDKYAYQFVITDKVEIISTLPLEVFNANVRSCIGNFEEAILVREYTNFNKGYELKLYQKDTNVSKVVYSVVDNIALDNYLDIVNPQYQMTLPQSRFHKAIKFPNSPSNGGYINEFGFYLPKKRSGDRYSRNWSFYDGTAVHSSVQQMNALSSPYFFNDDYYRSLVNGRNIFSAMILKNMYNKKIEVHTFKLNDGFVVVDKMNSTISVYSNDGELKSFNSLDFENKIIEMKQDPYTDEIYFTSKSENLFRVHRVNIENGSTHYVGGFKNIMLARSIKIFDGWIYYRVMKNDYYKIYRTRLRS